MNNYLMVVIVALGTYFLRLLPILLAKKGSISFLSGEILDYIATALLSALLVTTFLELPVTCEKSLVGLGALLGVYLSYYKWKSIGVSVVIGVMIHFLLSNLEAL